MGSNCYMLLVAWAGSLGGRTPEGSYAVVGSQMEKGRTDDRPPTGEWAFGSRCFNLNTAFLLLLLNSAPVVHLQSVFVPVARNGRTAAGKSSFLGNAAAAGDENSRTKGALGNSEGRHGQTASRRAEAFIFEASQLD